MSLAEALATAQAQTIRRFGVAWRNRSHRTIHHVAALDVLPMGYRFRYRDDIDSVKDFRPFVGFPDVRRTYESTRLWPFFDLRIMDRKRPDFAQYVSWLGLSVDAKRVDILARAAGELKGDTVLLAEAPPVAPDGTTSQTFIVRGVGHAVRAFASASTIERLGPGDQLSVKEDRANEVNPEALLLTSAGTPLGWVPDLLVDYARAALRSGGTVTVVQNNGSGAPWHSRLLVRLDGHVPPGWFAFDGPPWPPLGSPSLG